MVYGNRSDVEMIRLCFFSGLLVLFILWEVLFPARKQGRLLLNRVCNLSLSALNTLLLSLLPVSAAGAAQSFSGGGLFGYLGLQGGGVFVLSLLVLDLAVYFQHLMFHTVPLFWQLHKVHHADSTINTTSAVRFHPVEMILSLCIKVSVILLFGISPREVLVFEIILNGCSLFNHACIFLPGQVDRVLRFLIVTPDMHRIHHSVRLRETNRNFGFCLTWWDFLFGTYRDKAVQENFKLGISPYRHLEERSLVKSLLMPFDGKGKAYSIGGIGRHGS